MIRVVSLGGTILQRAVDGRMRVEIDPTTILPEAPADVEWLQLERRLAADLTFDDVLAVRREALRQPCPAGVVLITGTDSLEEVAFLLDRLLLPDRPFVVTGAMKPADAVGYDGAANLMLALATARDPAAGPLGVLAALNDRVHAARAVTKDDSALIGAFRSHPGPVGEWRDGAVRWHVAALPAIARFPRIDEDRLRRLNVPVVPMTLSGDVPPDVWLEQLDGLVLAGFGTGTLPAKVIDRLAPWTGRLPIAIATRCAIGLNVDAALYRGSRDKYERLGFRLAGYEGLNALQARLRLCLELASTAAGPIDQ